MSSDGAELASMAGAVEDLQRRVTGVAGRYEGTERDDVLNELYEVERALRLAGRRLAAAVRALS